MKKNLALLAAMAVPFGYAMHNSGAKIEKLQKQIWQLEDRIAGVSAESEIEDYKLSLLIDDLTTKGVQERSYSLGRMFGDGVLQWQDLVFADWKKEIVRDRTDREERILRGAKKNPSMGLAMSRFLESRVTNIGYRVRDEREKLALGTGKIKKVVKRWVEVFEQESKRVRAMTKPRGNYIRARLMREMERAKRLEKLRSVK